MDKDLQELLQLIVNNMATKDGIRNMATKDDIRNMATKDDIQTLTDRLDGQDEKIDGLTVRLEQQDEKIDGLAVRLEQQDEKLNDLTGIVLNLENNLTNRIESLFDGYKLTHEKQWELEHKMEALEKRLEIVELKMA